MRSCRRSSSPELTDAQCNAIVNGHILFLATAHDQSACKFDYCWQNEQNQSLPNHISQFHKPSFQRVLEEKGVHRSTNGDWSFHHLRKQSSAEISPADSGRVDGIGPMAYHNSMYKLTKCHNVLSSMRGNQPPHPITPACTELKWRVWSCAKCPLNFFMSDFNDAVRSGNNT